MKDASQALALICFSVTFLTLPMEFHYNSHYTNEGYGQICFVYRHGDVTFNIRTFSAEVSISYFTAIIHIEYFATQSCIHQITSDDFEYLKKQI